MLALTVATLGALPGTTQAAPAPQPPTPRTTAEVRAELTRLTSEAEIVAEDYNDARVTLARRNREFKAADAQARKVQAQYAALAGEVKRVVSGAYLAVPFSQFTLMLTSESPRQFMDQLSALNMLATRRSAVINKVAAVRKAALDAQAKAQAALTAAQKVERDIKAKKNDLNKRAAVLQGILSRLAITDADFTGRGPRGSRSVPRGPVNVGPASPAALKAVSVALDQRGDPYYWAAAGPDQFDCSGLVMYAWAAAGVSLPHSSASMASAGVSVSRNEVRAGDLVVFYSPVHHVGLAINNRQMVHAPNSGQPVQVSDIDAYPYTGARRVG